MPCVITASQSSDPTPLELARLQRQIWRLVCSSAWFDRCWAECISGRLANRRRADNALDRAALYPPGGRPRPGFHRTLMRRCANCGSRWYPPQYLRGCGICEDCVAALAAPLTDEHTHVPSTESPTADALRHLENYGVRLVEPRLPAEDEASLRREIAAHLRHDRIHSCQHGRDAHVTARRGAREGLAAPLANTKNHE